MRRILLALSLTLFTIPAWAQCNGVFAANQLCGRGATNGPPTAVSLPSVLSNITPFAITSANPVTVLTPTVTINRFEAITQDSSSGNSGALMVTNRGNNITTLSVDAQTIGLSVVASQVGVGEVVGGFFSTQEAGAPVDGTHNVKAYGIFSYAQVAANATNINGAIGINSFVDNETGIDCPIANIGTRTACWTVAHMAQGGGAHLNTAGLYIVAASPSYFDTGIYIDPGAVKTNAFTSNGFNISASGKVTIANSVTSAPVLTVRNTHASASDNGIEVDVGVSGSDTTSYEIVFYDASGTNLQGGIARGGAGKLSFNPSASDVGASCPSGVNATTVVVVGGIVVHC